MREIQFRAWDKEAKEMLPNVQNHIGPVESAFGGLLRQDRYIIMQYTGRKDKNGVEIYGGDRIASSGYVGNITWSDKLGAWTVVYPETFANTEGSDLLCDHPTEGIEVIGNIHEDKNLLDTKHLSKER